jgi:hypothetical protein
VGKQRRPGQGSSGSHWIGDLTNVLLCHWLVSDGDGQWLCLDEADSSSWRRRAAQRLHPSKVHGVGAQPWSILAMLIGPKCLSFTFVSMASTGTAHGGGAKSQSGASELWDPRWRTTTTREPCHRHLLRQSPLPLHGATRDLAWR